MTTRAMDRRVAWLEIGHVRNGRTYVITKHAHEPDDQAVALAGIAPIADDRVIIVNFYGGDDPNYDGSDGGLDGPGRRLLAVW